MNFSSLQLLTVSYFCPLEQNRKHLSSMLTGLFSHIPKPQRFYQPRPSGKQTKMAEPNQKHRTRKKSLSILRTDVSPGAESRWKVWRWTWRGKEDIQPRDSLSTKVNTLSSPFIHCLLPSVSIGLYLIPCF